MSDDFDKDGFLAKRFGSKVSKRRLGKPKWHIYYFNLIGGSLFYYKEFEDHEPKGTVQLKGMTLVKDDPQGSRKKYCFGLKDDKSDYLFSCEDETEWKEWTQAIEANLNKDPRPALKKEKKLNRVEQLAQKAKKNVVGKAATSALGKQAIRAHAPEEVKNLVAALKRVVEKEGKNSKKASEIEENIYKISIKTYFIISDGKLTMDDVLVADKPLRKSMEILAKCYDHTRYARKVDHEALKIKFQEVQKLLQEAGEILTKLLTGHMKPHNVQKIKDTVEFIANPDFLMRVFQDESVDEDLQELISAADHYTQFHFYSEKEK